MENKLTPPKGYVELPTILLVDDDPDIIEFINQAMRVFAERRFNIVFATSGEGAVGMLNLQPIDAIVLDIKLPDVTGINIGEKIKKYNPEMPIAIFTSYSGENVKRQVEAIGAVYWYKLDLMSNPEKLLNYLYSLLDHKTVFGEEHTLVSMEELRAMRQRRSDRIGKIPFPNYLIRSQVKRV